MSYGKNYTTSLGIANRDRGEKPRGIGGEGELMNATITGKITTFAVTGKAIKISIVAKREDTNTDTLSALVDQDLTIEMRSLQETLGKE